MSWRDRIPPNAPRPKPGETMRRYLLRTQREAQQAAVDKLGEGLRRARGEEEEQR